MSFTLFKKDQRPVIKASARITRAEFLSSEDHVAGSLVKSDTSTDKTFLFACAEGVEETHHNLKVLIMATNIKRLGHCFWCGDFKVYNLLLCEY